MNVGDILGKLRRKIAPAAAEKRPFVRHAETFARRIKDWEACPKLPPKGTRVGVLVTPWMFTAVPFFSLECAMLLRSQGLEVVILWDASNTFFNAATAREIETIQRLLRRLPDDLSVIDIATASADGDIDEMHLEGLIFENSVREFRGESAAREFLASHPERRMHVLEHARQVAHVFGRERWDWVLIPGGVWAVSGVCVHIAERLKLAYSTFDSGVGELVLTHGAVAAHFGDFPEVFAEVQRRCDANPAEREIVMQHAQQSLQTRMEGRDTYRLQLRPASSDAADRCDILVALNFRLDSAALLRQKLFTSITHWLRSILEWLVTQPGVTLAIRQHPCERIPEYRGGDRWEDLLAEFPALKDRVRLVRAEDPVNTYDLISSAKVVLPFTSRVGIEASLLGKPVILCAHCYYESLPFVWSPSTAAEYFCLIRAALDESITVAPAAREVATIAYCLAEECLLLATTFTPIPSDYEKWVEVPPAAFWAREEMREIREALVARRHLPLLSYERRVAEKAWMKEAAPAHAA
jgi:hypothetical protein